MPLCLAELKKGVRTAVLGNPLADERLADMRVLFIGAPCIAVVLSVSAAGQRIALSEGFQSPLLLSGIAWKISSVF